jgi:hypothetical protein
MGTWVMINAGWYQHARQSRGQSAPGRTWQGGVQLPLPDPLHPECRGVARSGEGDGWCKTVTMAEVVANNLEQDPDKSRLEPRSAGGTF